MFAQLNKLHNRITQLTLALVLVLGATVIFSVRPVAAAEPAQTPTFDYLEQFYQRLLLAVDSQQLRYQTARLLATDTQTWIDARTAEGKDMSAVQTALNNFTAALSTAEGYTASADAILTTHAGFDDAGQVIDQQAARTTLRDSGRALRDANRTLTDATIELRRTISDTIRALRES